MGLLEFNEDGTLKIPEFMKKEKVEENPELDYLYVLRAITEIPFPVGKKLLISFLQRDIFNKSIMKNKLDKLKNFGKLRYYTEDKIDALIERLALNGMIELKKLEEDSFFKVYFITKKGKDELDNPSMPKKKISTTISDTKTEITSQDLELFREFGSFLEKYNDPQKKAIISNAEKILCIAGAGSGKTTVLTKRIEFLVKYRSVPAEKILAITFTRKARQEMQSRLASLNLSEIKVETFNSFCEKILRDNSSLIYGREMNVMAWGDKMQAIKYSLDKLNLDIVKAVNIYFSDNQRHNKTDEELIFSFINDCFFILDYYKSKNEKLEDFSLMSEAKDKEGAKMIYNLCKEIEEYMKQNSLRDYTDQLIDTLKLFKEHPDKILKFDHVLVDEYQDVNSSQVELIEFISEKNLFCVGDPRQSIYGWRGSDISYILNFNQKYPECNVINLTKNYRSNKHIVDLINASIKEMNLPDLEHNFEGDKKISICNFDSEEQEYQFVVNKIKETQEDRNEIFVLSRTNRQLKELSKLMKMENINHIIRSDEIRSTVIAKNGDVTLATVHAIKGLEANTVFIIGCNNLNFPCRVSDHPVIEMVKTNEYDKEEEERRLFYVAMSRAREKLFMSYSGKKCTYFINEDMKRIIQKKDIESIFETKKEKSPDLMQRFRQWRLNKAREESVPAYCILTDKTIQEIISKMPQERRDLESIYGLGYTKIMNYGDEILDLLG